MTCTMKADNAVADGTYQLDENGALVDYAAKWGFGFIVGLPGGRTVNPGEHFSVGNVQIYAALKGWRLFGVWIDPDTGIQYIDPVEHVSDLGTARARATERGEIAIYDLMMGECITI